jgi:hypothetical protein
MKNDLLMSFLHPVHLPLLIDSFFLDTDSSLCTQTLAATMDSPQDLTGVDDEQETEASRLPKVPIPLFLRRIWWREAHLEGVWRRRRPGSGFPAHEWLLSGVGALVTGLDVQVAELVAGWWLEQPAGWAWPLRHL